MALRQLGGAVALVGAPSSVYLISYDSYPGLRRSLQFWSTLGPKLVEYKFLVTRASFQGEEGAKNLPKQLKEFHIRTAGEAVAIILSLGGIYVKLGQLMSTMGAALFEEEYIVALTPLQDGVPPRSFQEVKRIIEDDCGRPMDLLFSSFDPTPIGAASIAQAHHATLADGTAVVVKVQYPEVASHYAADFDNLEVLCGWLFPEKLNLVHGLRKRHEGELDFRVEASNLRECAANAKAKGFMKLREKEQAEKSSSSSSASSFSVPPSPVLACGLGAVGEGLIRSVVLPGVPCEGLVTRHVLAMEFLQGVSLAKAIEQEHQEVVKKRVKSLFCVRSLFRGVVVCFVCVRKTWRERRRKRQTNSRKKECALPATHVHTCAFEPPPRPPAQDGGCFGRGGRRGRAQEANYETNAGVV
mmetsp:Transcript_12541/g.25522  ORF Transcript_12541/g.25522 Transcript_12541/m.25522 type:complete len:413 (-) Transcript_12541:1293-2531(-)